MIEFVTLTPLMDARDKDPKFFVVGGPIQPGRGCYVQRVADAELFRRVSDGDYCHVLAQRQSGKTSLAAGVAAKLRARESCVAVVDLTEASAEDPSVNAGRWYYSILYRIARDLRIRADVQTWWAERGGLTNLQRLREFFQEIVLQECTDAVAIFIDRVEVTLDEPLAQDLFACIRACHDARATNPDFNRLTFVMLGSAPADELVRSVQGSPFEVSTAVSLEDFSAQEMAGLLTGLGDLGDEAEAVNARVWSWTRGHPYLSQKVFRGLSRRRDAITVAAVDELVRTQFGGSATLRDEPHISAIAQRLLRPGPGRAPRLNLYGRIRKGIEVGADPASVPQHELLMAGVIVIGPAGDLRIRNEIYAMVFSTRWANQNLPFGVRGIALAAAVVACLIALPVWYTEVLPKPYLKALTVLNQDVRVAEDAYRSLANLPGFAATADELYAEYLGRRSEQSDALAEVLRINDKLDPLPGGREQAAELLARFWQRRAQQYMHAGRRDEALMAALEALQEPTAERRSLVAELTGADYRSLRASLHSGAPLSALGADPASGLLTLLDEQNTLQLWRLDGEGAEPVRSLRLIAEERLQLEQRRGYAGLPAQPRLLLQVDHALPQQVQVALRAPTGQQAVLSLAAAERADALTYVFDFGRYPQLRQLAQGQLDGNWTLELTDNERGVQGEFLGWFLGGPELAAVPDGQLLRQPVPEPRPSVNAVTRLSHDGQLALVWPANPDTAGPILVRDVINDTVLARMPRGPDLRDAHFVLGDQRVLTVAGQTVQLRDVADGRLVGQFEPASRGLPRFAFSADGRYAAVPVRGQDDAAVAVWDLQTLTRVRTITAAAGTGSLAVDTQGRHLAIGGRDGIVRVWSLQDGSLSRSFAAAAAIRSVRFDATGRWLAVDDFSSTFRLWDVSRDAAAPVVERAGGSVWSPAFSADGRLLLLGSADRAYQVFDLDSGQRAMTRLRHTAVDSADPRGDALLPRVLAGPGLVVTSDGAANVKVWALPALLPAGRAPGLPGDMRTALSSDGRWLAAGSHVRDINLYAVGAPGGRLLDAGSAPASDDNVALVCLEFAADRSLLAAGAMDGVVRIWRTAADGVPVRTVSHADGPVHDVLFSADGTLLFSASRLEVQVTELASGATLARLPVRANNPQLSYAATSGELFVAGDQLGVTRWRWRDNLSAPAISSRAAVTRAAVTADGKRLVTADSERRLTVWDVERRAPLGPPLRVAAKVDALWLTAGGRRVLVQAGNWLHRVAVQSGGLTPRDTRLLPDTPAAVQAGEGDSGFAVLLPAPGRPELRRIAMNVPRAEGVIGNPVEIRREWRRRLAMTLDDAGRAVPLAPEVGAADVY